MMNPALSPEAQKVVKAIQELHKTMVGAGAGGDILVRYGEQFRCRYDKHRNRWVDRQNSCIIVSNESDQDGVVRDIAIFAYQLNVLEELVQADYLRRLTEEFHPDIYEIVPYVVFVIDPTM